MCTSLPLTPQNSRSKPHLHHGTIFDINFKLISRSSLTLNSHFWLDLFNALDDKRRSLSARKYLFKTQARRAVRNRVPNIRGNPNEFTIPRAGGKVKAKRKATARLIATCGFALARSHRRHSRSPLTPVFAPRAAKNRRAFRYHRNEVANSAKRHTLFKRVLF